MRLAILCSLSLFLFLVSACGGHKSSPPVASDYTAFGNPERITLSGYTGDAMEPFLSRDGKYLFFNSLNDASTDKNIYYATYVNDTTFTFQGVIGGVNTAAVDGVPSMDNTNTFY